jgi:hypothetical protein
VTNHAKMSMPEWQQAYRAAWNAFYTPDHLEAILRRAAASGINIRSLMPVLLWFSSATLIENLHPLQWGILRRKYRKDRRPGLPIEPVWSFYPKLIADFTRKNIKLVRRWRMLNLLVRKIEADPAARLYADSAMTPVQDEDAAHMELYTQNEAARTAVIRERRVAGLHAAE